MTAVVVARSCAMEDSKEGAEVKVGGDVRVQKSEK